MQLRVSVFAILLFAALVGCLTPSATNSRPDDFSITYQWQEGSLPPPFHYEYRITLQPTGQGEVVMIPDYPSEQVPTWTETFTVQPVALDNLYQVMVDNGLFTHNWRAQENPPVGGSSQSMVVTAHGEQITIPAYVMPGLETTVTEMYSAVTALVPPNAWATLDMQRQQYIQEHQD